MVMIAGDLHTHVAKPHDDKVWWFDKPISPEPDGTWKTNVYPGSKEYPVSDGASETNVEIQAVVATEEEVRNEIRKHNNDRYFDDPSIFRVRSPLVIEVTIKPTRKVAP